MDIQKMIVGLFKNKTLQFKLLDGIKRIKGRNHQLQRKYKNNSLKFISETYHKSDFFPFRKLKLNLRILFLN
jgi:hypothetical protein